MKTLIIEIARPGKPNNQVLNQENRYIALCGTKPQVSFSIDCGQDEFIKTVNGLRYDDADPASSAKAIDFFHKLTTRLFADIQYLSVDINDYTPLHIRLVTTPLELAQIPFEFALTPVNLPGEDETPLFAHPLRKVTLTREVRQVSETRYRWPYKPRILFAWAAPKNTVPHEEHRIALEKILKPLAKPKANNFYPEPDIEDFLTELPDASLESIKEAIAKGITDRKPYTHINILAHGSESNRLGVTEFRLLLCKKGQKNVSEKAGGEELAKALITNNYELNPTVVTLSACDSGNVGNTILPAGSLVYQLHNAGIPCVFASQFPLTQQGSVKLVKTLYDQLINACDPRMALYDTRINLKNEPNHDWASLVAYARFPENINEQLQDAQLKLAFSSMKTTNVWVDHIFKFKEHLSVERREEALKELQQRLDNSIVQLGRFLNEGKRESMLLTSELRAEHFGLLASAQKRKAEYYFRLTEFNPEREKELREHSSAALKEAMDYYRLGFESNTASHWNAMQYLSLKAVSDGSLKDEGELWPVVKYMAQKDEKNAKMEVDKIWAWGTLAELYMLKSLTVDESQFLTEFAPSITIAKDFMRKIAAADPEYNAAKESTARQFERYIYWWPFVFLSVYPEWLKDTATELRDILPSLEELIR